MEGILTTEEKKYLRRVCNYLGSLGMSSGVISFNLENEQDEISEDDLNLEYVTNFDNNYRADIPENLYPILKKIINHIVINNLFKLPDDIDYISNQGIEIEIICDSNEITVSNWYYYEDRGDSFSVVYDSDEDITRFERWVDEDLGDVEVPSDGILTISYNGGGDEGYLESSFNGVRSAVPTSIENWCYRQLEENFGGWEINEGSDGQFIFNFNNFIVELEHTYNVQVNETNTLYEENFGK